MRRMPLGRGAARWRARLGGLTLAVAFCLSLPAQADSFPLGPHQVLVGTAGTHITRAEDTLLDVARNNDLGYGQLMAVNPGIDPWLPGDGSRVTLPSLYLVPDGPRKGIVINLAEQRLYYFPPDGGTVETYPLGTGVPGWPTPLGETRIVTKEVMPSWHPPPSIREERPWLPEVIPPGPANPLGDFALRLGWSGYLLHGTNRPYGVGRNVSHGCIRLYPEDIEHLFAEVRVGTPVRVINEEIRLAWVGDDLYLLVTPTQQQRDQLAINQPMIPEVPPDLADRVVAAAGTQVHRVDWDLVRRLGVTRSGMPIRITRPAESGAGLPIR